MYLQALDNIWLCCLRTWCRIILKLSMFQVVHLYEHVFLIRDIYVIDSVIDTRASRSACRMRIQLQHLWIPLMHKITLNYPL
jgi:hypothetical protein